MRGSLRGHGDRHESTTLKPRFAQTAVESHWSSGRPFASIPVFVTLARLGAVTRIRAPRQGKGVLNRSGRLIIVPFVFDSQSHMNNTSLSR